jgi:signal transduction histidine kinase
MVFFDRDGRILFANRVAETVIGDRPTALAEIPEPLGPVLTSALDRSEEVRNAKVVIPGARAREFLVSVFFVTAADQHPAGGVVVLRDLDSIKTLQLVVSYSARLAALGRLTSGVAHELKNPLNAMMVHVELLREELGDTPGEAGESLQSLAREIRRLDGMVQGFLRVIRPQDLALTLIDVNALVLDVAALLEPEWQPEGVRFACERDPDLPLIQADGALLQQAFLNVLLNACEAMPAGGAVTIATRRDGPDGIAVRFADDGVGIPPEQLERIFELYYTTKPGGSGIGLSVVHRIVHLHDGEIGVESAPGRGTTVTVRLPVRGPVLSQSPSFALSASEVS